MYTNTCKVRQPAGIRCLAQGAQIWGLVTASRGGMGREVGGSRGREHTYTNGWLMLIHGRTNTVL